MESLFPVPLKASMYHRRGVTYSESDPVTITCYTLPSIFILFSISLSIYLSLLTFYFPFLPRNNLLSRYCLLHHRRRKVFHNVTLYYFVADPRYRNARQHSAQHLSNNTAHLGSASTKTSSLELIGHQNNIKTAGILLCGAVVCFTPQYNVEHIMWKPQYNVEQNWRPLCNVVQNWRPQYKMEQDWKS